MNEKTADRSIAFICNPIAGNGASLKALFTVKGRMAAAELSYTIDFTKCPGHATELARAAAARGAQIVCAVGGDGTIREVALGLTDTETVMGILPCGTGNDLVKTLNIPMDANAALDILLTGKVIDLNCAYANELPYVNVAGFGFDVDVLDKVELYKKSTKSGRMAYLKGLFSAIRHRQIRKVTYTLDDGEPVSVNALMIAAGNGRYIGGGICITPGAVLTDGLLDFTVVHDVYSIWDVLRVLPVLMNGKLYTKTQYVTHMRGKKLTAVCDPFSRIQVDGERVPGTPVTFRVSEDCVRILVDSSYAE